MASFDPTGNSSVEELKNKNDTKEHLKHIAREFDIPLSHDTRQDDLINDSRSPSSGWGQATWS